MADDRVDIDDHGVDDVAIHNVSLFRLERMSATGFWIRCYKPDGNDIVFWVNSASKITVGFEYDPSKEDDQ